jgi:hypothetical protein
MFLISPIRSFVIQVLMKSILIMAFRVTGFNQKSLIQTPQNTHYWSRFGTLFFFFIFSYLSLSLNSKINTHEISNLKYY